MHVESVVVQPHFLLCGVGVAAWYSLGEGRVPFLHILRAAPWHVFQITLGGVVSFFGVSKVIGRFVVCVCVLFVCCWGVMLMGN